MCKINIDLSNVCIDNQSNISLKDSPNGLILKDKISIEHARNSIKEISSIIYSLNSPIIDDKTYLKISEIIQ